MGCVHHGSCLLAGLWRRCLVRMPALGSRRGRPPVLCPAHQGAMVANARPRFILQQGATCLARQRWPGRQAGLLTCHVCTVLLR